MASNRLPNNGALHSNGTFQNTEDGFRVQVPEGWVVQDIDNTKTRSAYLQLGYGILALIFPQEQALPAIGELLNCEQSDISVTIFQYRTLKNKPEFAIVENPADISLDDFLAISVIQALQEGDYKDIKIVNSSDMTIKVTSPENRTDRQHVLNWLRLFMLYLSTGMNRNKFATFLILDGG